MMKTSYVLMLAAVSLAAASCADKATITVGNTLDMACIDEIAEFQAEQLTARFPNGFVITDGEGREVPYQFTYDGKVVMPVTVGENATATYTVVAETPSTVDTLVYGKFYPERKDDFTWENEHSAYRAYGPELQRSGERAFGYDIWTKSVDTLVVEQRYREHMAGINSFHHDNGNGMDVYNVGPTLGGGATALLDSVGNVIYPYAFSNYELLDNGPLRMTVRLTYLPTVVGQDSDVVETRLITLDRNALLNRTVVRYEGLSKPAIVASGIVVHAASPDSYDFVVDKGIMAYDDPTDNTEAGNGRIYVGIIAPEGAQMEYRSMAEPAGDAVGHILAVTGYEPGSDYTYYWGAGWSKGGVESFDAWREAMADCSRRINTPLTVTIE